MNMSAIFVRVQKTGFSLVSGLPWEWQGMITLSVENVSGT